jgi:hypothetical protein
VWTQQQKLTAADGAADDFLGQSVAISGDTLVVGSQLDDVGATTNQGSAYVFTRSGGVWTEQQKLTAADGIVSDRMGASVAIDGDTVVVGVHLEAESPDPPNRGAAYVFTRSAGVWTQQAKLLAADGAEADFFGISVALEGDTAVVGAYGDDDVVGGSPTMRRGSAYVFIRSGTVWTEQQKLVAADGVDNDQLGQWVALSGDTVVAGAYDDDVGANVDQGSAYVFTRSGGVWTQQQQLTAADGAAGDQFGGSVAVVGDTAVVTASSDDVGANVDQGSAYVFTRSGTVWTQQQQLTASDGAAGDAFGASAAISGDTAVVGAYTDDVGANTDQGSAYVFTRVVSPTITGTPPSPVAANTPYSFAFTLTGVPTPTTSITSGSLPSGITLSSSGVLSGSAITAGTYTATATATNGVAPDATKTFTIVVNPTVTITPSSGPKGASVTLKGAGFVPGETVKFFYKTGLTSPKKLSLCNAIAISNGTATCASTIPTTNQGPKGAHTIVAKGATSLIKAKTTFTRT